MRDDVQLKIQWADKHINDLDDVLTAFKDSEPYGLATKRDTNTGEHVVYVAETKTIPDHISLIAGDVIHNLRSSLDYLAWQLVIAGGGKPTPSTAFPIVDHIPATVDQIARYERQVNGMRNEVKEIIKGLKPYRGQNKVLWRLHKLNNLNKHRALLAVGTNPSHVAAWGDIWDTGKVNFGLLLDQGSEVARFPPDSKNHENIQFTFDIALNEPEADAPCYPLIYLLKFSLNTVRTVVQRFDCYR